MPRGRLRSSRAFLVQMLGKPWREIESDLRRRMPIEVDGVTVEQADPKPEPANKEEER